MIFDRQKHHIIIGKNEHVHKSPNEEKFRNSRISGCFLFLKDALVISTHQNNHKINAKISSQK